MNSTLTGYLNTNPEVVQQLLERISKSRDYRLQLQKYISLSPEELVDIWNETINNLYANAEKIHFDGMYYRKDIGIKYKDVAKE